MHKLEHLKQEFEQNTTKAVKCVQEYEELARKAKNTEEFLFIIETSRVAKQVLRKLITN